MARILLAEDDESMRVFLANALRRAGHQVRDCADGLDALDAVKQEPFHLLLADIVMPGMDGISLALKVAREKPDVGILLMSGYAAERQRAHNLDELVHRVVSKPFTLRDICTAVDNALAGRTLRRAGHADPT